MASIDLHSLSDGERDALRLLAEGHTVKSIAALTGRSAHSVNERLRDARRKTGSGSSRELARLLREQENRDDKIGMVASQADDASRSGRAGGHRRRLPKGLFMAFGIGVIAATVLWVAALNSEPQIAIDQDSPEALALKLSRETRDTVWAVATEAELGRRYLAIQGVEPDVVARCAQTLCEVSGRLRSNGGSVTVNREMQVLQGSQLSADLRRSGLISASQSFGFDYKQKQMMFDVYWKRT